MPGSILIETFRQIFDCLPFLMFSMPFCSLHFTLSFKTLLIMASFPKHLTYCLSDSALFLRLIEDSDVWLVLINSCPRLKPFSSCTATPSAFPPCVSDNTKLWENLCPILALVGKSLLTTSVSCKREGHGNTKVDARNQFCYL